MKREFLVFKVFGGSLHKLSRFKWVTRETSYQLSIENLSIRNLKSQVVELVQRPTTILKVLYFSADNQFYQYSPGIKTLYNRGNFFLLFIGREGIIWEWGGNFSKIIHRGSHRGTSHQGTLG